MSNFFVEKSTDRRVCSGSSGRAGLAGQKEWFVEKNLLVAMDMACRVEYPGGFFVRFFFFVQCPVSSRPFKPRSTSPSLFPVATADVARI